jgi:porin
VADSVNGKTGALSPVNTNQLFPLPPGDNVALPALTFAQFLSSYGGVVVGKFDGMAADANEFAHGKYRKGETEFFNTALNINPVTFASTKGIGGTTRPLEAPGEIRLVK